MQQLRVERTEIAIVERPEMLDSTGSRPVTVRYRVDMLGEACRPTLSTDRARNDQWAGVDLADVRLRSSVLIADRSVAGDLLAISKDFKPILLGIVGEFNTGNIERRIRFGQFDVLERREARVTTRVRRSDFGEGFPPDVALPVLTGAAAALERPFTAGAFAASEIALGDLLRGLVLLLFGGGAHS